MTWTYTFKAFGERDNLFYGLYVNGVFVEYFCTLEALGCAIEDIKALEENRLPMMSNLAA